MKSHSCDELSWAAGLFDGEGCVSLVAWSPNDTRPRQFILTAVVTMTHKPTIEKLLDIFGMGSVFAPKVYGKNHRQSWRWAIRGASAAEFLSQIRPYSVTKASEIDVALRYQEWRNNIGKWKHLSEGGRAYGQMFVDTLKRLKRIEFQDGAGVEHEIAFV